MAIDDDDLPDEAAIRELRKAFDELNRTAEKFSEHAEDANEEFADLSSTGKELRTMFKEMSDTLKEMRDTSKDASVLEHASAEDKQKYMDMLLKEQDIKVKMMEKDADYAKMVKEASAEGLKRSKAMQEQAGYITNMKEGLKEAEAYASKMGNNMSQIMTGDRGGMAKVAGQAMSGIASLIPTLGPMGGLIGFLMHGLKNGDEWRAVGEQVGQQFDRMGQASSGFKSQMVETAKAITANSTGTADDLIAIAGAFAETGVSAETAGKTIDGFAGDATGGIKNLTAATLAADKTMEVASGTFAKIAGTLSRDFGGSADEAFMKISSFAGKMKDAGYNAVNFMQQIMETSSALRMMNANMDSVVGSQAALIQSYEKLGFSKQQAQKFGEGGGAVMAGMGRLNEGMMAYLGEQMTGGRHTGISALRAFESRPYREEKGLGDIDMMQALKIMGGLAGDDQEGQYKLFKSQFGSASAADAAMRMTALTPKQMAGDDGKKAMADFNEGIKSESDKLDYISKLLKAIEVHLGTVASSMLGMAIDSIKAIYYFLQSKFGDKDKATKDLYGQAADAAVARMGDNFFRIEKAFEKIGKQGMSLPPGLISDPREQGILEQINKADAVKKGKTEQYTTTTTPEDDKRWAEIDNKIAEDSGGRKGPFGSDNQFYRKKSNEARAKFIEEVRDRKHKEALARAQGAGTQGTGSQNVVLYSDSITEPITYTSTVRLEPNHSRDQNYSGGQSSDGGAH
jgi:hypothetical protein